MEVSRSVFHLVVLLLFNWMRRHPMNWIFMRISRPKYNLIGRLKKLIDKVLLLQLVMTLALRRRTHGLQFALMKYPIITLIWNRLKDGRKISLIALLNRPFTAITCIAHRNTTSINSEILHPQTLRKVYRKIPKRRKLFST